MSTQRKRKNTAEDSARVKRPRLDDQPSASSSCSATEPQPEQNQTPGVSQPHPRKGKGKGKGKPDAVLASNAGRDRKSTTLVESNTPKRGEIIRKLAPPRPFPTVPTSVSASGPKSAHKEGNNFICITRRTPLAAYLRRCKALLVEEGYKTLHLHAMGAAIPHLVTLSVSLPPILPFAQNEIKIDVRTGTIEVMDEIIPDDEDEDMTLRARGKGTVIVMVQVGGETLSAGAENSKAGPEDRGRKRKDTIVFQEQDQEDDEMDQDEEVDG